MGVIDKDHKADEIRHQLGNSLFILNGWYSRYCSHPEMVARCMNIMFNESLRLTRKLQKICEAEER